MKKAHVQPVNSVGGESEWATENRETIKKQSIEFYHWLEEEDEIKGGEEAEEDEIHRKS